MTVRMATDEALEMIDELRSTARRPAVVRDDIEWRDAAARVTLLVDAARTANNDTVGDPHQVVADLASPTLTKRLVMRWFSTLIEAVAEFDQLVAWRTRTHGQHRAGDSAALNECVAVQTNRAALAVAVLLYGEPDLEDVAA